MSSGNLHNNSGQSGPAELDKINALLNNASVSIDNGSYEDAINYFEEVIQLAQSVFGENIELMEVKRKIKEVQKQLEDMQ